VADASSGDPGRERLPEQAVVGLLPYLSAHAIDEDYALAAARRQVQGRERRPIGKLGAGALAVFALLAITAAVQTSRNSVSEERDRRALVAQVKDQQEELDQRRKSEAALRAEIRELEAQRLRNTDDSNGLLAQVQLLSLRSGTAAVRGPGVELRVDDAPHAEEDRDRVLDSDLQKIVNALWAAGAEAVSINGERLTALSAIRHAGQAITVNYHSLTRPYRILAIGDVDTLPTRFADSTTGPAWLDLQREVGLQFSMRTQKSLRLPAAAVPLFRYVDTPQRRTP
jgi:uncharacterized protein YlxW (UPF0749 family)